MVVDFIKEQQMEGYNAGYGISSGGYGFHKIDAQGNIIETVHYSAEKKLVGKDFYTYDADGKEIEESCYKADGSLIRKLISRYDNNGNRSEQGSYLDNGRLEEKRAWAYDSSHNVIEETFFEAGTINYKISYSYKYDRVGNWIKRVKVSQAYKGGQAASPFKEIVERTITYD